MHASIELNIYLKFKPNANIFSLVLNRCVFASHVYANSGSEITSKLDKQTLIGSCNIQSEVSKNVLYTRII